MRIVIVQHGAFPGCHAPDAREYAKHLVKNGFEVEVWCSRIDDAVAVARERFDVVPLGGFSAWARARYVSERAKKADIVHYLPGFGCEYIPCVAKRAVTIFDYRSASVRGSRILDGAIDVAKRCQASLADHVITIDVGVAKRLSPLWRKPISIVPAGYPSDLFFPCERLVSPERVLLYTGVLARSRRLERVLEALALLPEQYSLQVVGPGTRVDQTYPDELRALARHLGISKRVSWRPGVPQYLLRDIIAKAYICLCPIPVVPCYNHQFPYKLFDYLGCHRPVLATRTHAILQFSQHVPGGILLAEDTSLGMAEAILRSDDYIGGFYSDERLRVIDAALRPYAWASVVEKRLIPIYSNVSAAYGDAVSI